MPQKKSWLHSFSLKSSFGKFPHHAFRYEYTVKFILLQLCVKMSKNLSTIK